MKNTKAIAAHYALSALEAESIRDGDARFSLSNPYANLPPLRYDHEPRTYKPKPLDRSQSKARKASKAARKARKKNR